MASFSEQGVSMWVFEQLRQQFSADLTKGHAFLHDALSLSVDTHRAVADPVIAAILSELNAATTEFVITSILILLEEYAGELIKSASSLTDILTSLRGIIDKKGHESAGITDTVKCHALTAYTTILIQFSEETVAIRAQFMTALIEMIQRRNWKKKDYVNSLVRACACECLSELEKCFPGEVTQALKLYDWLCVAHRPSSSSISSSSPYIVEVIQDEILTSQESYARLFLDCCCYGISLSDRVNEKALVKVISLLLDSLESGSHWFRVSVAVGLDKFMKSVNIVVSSGATVNSGSTSSIGTPSLRSSISGLFVQSSGGGWINASSATTSDIWTSAVIRHHFTRLLDSMDVFQVHAFLWIFQFSNAGDLDFIMQVIDKMYSIVLEPANSAIERILAVHWLVGIASWSTPITDSVGEISSATMFQLIYSKRRLLVPRLDSSEPEAFTESKLVALLALETMNCRGSNKEDGGINRHVAKNGPHSGIISSHNLSDCFAYLPDTGVGFRFVTRLCLLSRNSLNDNLFREDINVMTNLSSPSKALYEQCFMYLSSCCMHTKESQRHQLNNVICSVIAMLQILRELKRDCFNYLINRFGKFLNAIQPPNGTLAYFPLITFLATAYVDDQPAVFEKQLSSPQICVVDCLVRYLDSCSSQIIDWTDGLKIIEVTRLLVLHSHGDMQTGGAVEKLLQKLHGCSKHLVDIQDRSGLYVKYLNQLPEEIRKRFLAVQTGEKRGRDSLITEQIPPRVHNRTIIHSEQELVHAISFTKNFALRRDRLRINDNGWAVFGRNRDNDNDSSRSITLPFMLEFSKDEVSANSPIPSSIYGIEISFMSLKPHATIDPVVVPYLERCTEVQSHTVVGESDSDCVAPLTEASSSTFPYKYNVELQLEVVDPVPITFDMQVVFTDSAGQTHSGKFGKFTVSFVDLLLPGDIGPRISDNIFTSLWTTHDPFAKLLRIGKLQLEKIIIDRLSHFQVPKVILDSLPPVPEFDFEHELMLLGKWDLAASIGLVDSPAILVALPPNHLLAMRFLMGEFSSVVWIATNHVPILAQVDELLASWEECEIS